MMRAKKPLSWLLVLVFLFTALLPSHAALAEEPSKKVRVGYMLMDRFQEGKEGHYKSGYGYEYLQEIANLTGWHYEYVYGTFDELLEKLALGEIDMLGYVSHTPERAEHMEFTDFPQGREFFFIYTLKTKDITPLTSTNFPEGRTIGVIATSYHEMVLNRWLEQQGIRCKVKTFEKNVDLYRALEMGEVDGIASSDHSITLDYTPVTRIGFENFYLSVSKNRPDLVDELNQAQYEIFNNNRSFNTNLYSKYYSDMNKNLALTPKNKEWLKSHDNTIHLGYLTNNRPYAFRSKTGQLTGIMATLVKVFEEDYGIKVETRAFDTPKAMLRAAQDGEIDVYGPLYADHYLSENQKICNTNLLISTTLMLLHHDPNINTKKMRIAYAEGNAIQQSILQVAYPRQTYIKYPDKKSCLEAVRYGEADSLLFSTASMNYYKRFDEFKDLNVTELDHEIGVCLGVNEGNANLLSLVNTVIAAAETRMGKAAFVENSVAEITAMDFMREHSLAIMGILFIVILILLAFIVYYLHTTSTILKMKNDNETLTIQAYRDELTKVGNRAAFLDQEAHIDDLIKQSDIGTFGVIVIDINGLKTVNDNHGHELGDLLIKNASHAVCEIFKKSPVYRVGGDEFVVLLRNDDFENRLALAQALRARCSDSLEKDDVENGAFSLAMGIAVFDADKDHTVLDVLNRADLIMYENKEAMKGV